MIIFHSVAAFLGSVVPTKTVVGGTGAPSMGNMENLAFCFNLLKKTCLSIFPRRQFSKLLESKDLPLLFVNIQQVNSFESACETDLFKE